MTRQFLARRLDSIAKVQQELAAWKKTTSFVIPFNGKVISIKLFVDFNTRIQKKSAYVITSNKWILFNPSKEQIPL